jgi:FlaG/FlaF family flagellin (archaellin)
MTTIPPLAATVNITIEQGAHFSLQILWKDASGDPVDLTGYTARMPVRAKSDDTLMLDLTTENSQIVLGGTDGTIDLDLDEDVTAALALKSGRHNLELIPPSGETRRLAQGDVKVSAEVLPS